MPKAFFQVILLAEADRKHGGFVIKAIVINQELPTKKKDTCVPIALGDWQFQEKLIWLRFIPR